MNNSTTKCLYVQVSDLDQSLALYRDVLGMPTTHAVHQHEPCILVDYTTDTQLVLTLKRYSKQVSEVEITSYDCLEDYCKLTAFGLKVLAKPAYDNSGLLAKLQDTDGNAYLLRELRDYNREV
jgi:catechol 2,3-dioxygenase-like lactoylglutathione lyase family enzyme